MPDDTDAPTLLLLPGLGADRRLYDPQRAALEAAGVRLITPNYLPARPTETMAAYADRYAAFLSETLDLRPPLIVGGLSFGGMVAWEAARRLRPRAVLLVAGCRTGRQIARSFRVTQRMAQFVPAAVADRLLDRVMPWGLSKWQGLDPEASDLLRQIAAGADVAMLKWAGRTVAAWEGPDGFENVPVHAIHGDNDQVIPLNGVLADPAIFVEEVVAGGRHLLNLTHPDRVSLFLAEWTWRYSAARPPAGPPTAVEDGRSPAGPSVVQ